MVPHIPLGTAPAGRVQGMATALDEKLRALAADEAKKCGLDVEKLTFTRAGAKSSVKIAVDADQRPDLDLLEEASQLIGAAFDAAEEAQQIDLGPSYTLEVTTPGLDFPLREARHFQRNIGRLANLPGGGKGRIAGVENDEVAILPAAKKTGKKSQGKRAGKKTPQAPVQIYPLAVLAGSTIEVEFSPAPAAEQELLGLTMAEYHELAKSDEA